MRMGVVFEIRNGKAVLMQNDGEFVTVLADRSWQEGDIVPIQKEISWVKPVWRIAACFLILFLCGGAGLYWDQTALISFDINPSFEIAVNRFDRVIHIQAVNGEGEEILSEVSIGNKKYDEALAELFLSDKIMPYLSENSNITFSVLADSTQKGQAISTGLEKTVDIALRPQHETLQVECYIVDEQTLENAHAYDVTAGKYLLLLQLQEADPAIDIQEYTHHSISQIKEQTEYCKNVHQLQLNKEAEEETETEVVIPQTNCESVGHHGHCGHR